MRSISELKDAYRGRDIYVLGSGTSLDFYDQRFFENKTLIGCNYVHRKVHVNFTVATHKELVSKSADRTTLVISDVDPSPAGLTPNIISADSDAHFFFKIGKYCDFDTNLSDVGKIDTLCLGNSIAISAVNFAAHLGASTIFLVGVDCCTVNGKKNFKGYYATEPYYADHDELAWENYRHYVNDSFLRNAKELSLLKNKVQEVYGCSIVSISPFFGLKNNAVLLKDYLSVQDVKKMREV